MSSTRIDFVLNGDLANIMKSHIKHGHFKTKPEIVRQALRLLFTQLEKQELQRTILETLLEE